MFYDLTDIHKQNGVISMFRSEKEEEDAFESLRNQFAKFKDKEKIWKNDDD